MSCWSCGSCALTAEKVDAISKSMKAFLLSGIHSLHTPQNPCVGLEILEGTFLFSLVSFYRSIVYELA